jgi:serine/threonine protein kinase
LNIESLSQSLLFNPNEKELNHIRKNLINDLNSNLEAKVKDKLNLNQFASQEIKNLTQKIRDLALPGMSKDLITDKQVESIFKYIEKNKESWMKEIQNNNLPGMYIRRGQGSDRTIRIDKEGNVFIILNTTLGKGSFKRARLAIDYNNKKIVANVSAKVTNANKQALIKEFTFTTPFVDAKNLVRQGSILEYSDKNDDYQQKMSVIMPLYNEIDMENVKKAPLTGKQKKKIVLDSLMGLKKLHSEGIIHRDIKPANIFIKSKMNPMTKKKEYAAKIGDFGFASKLEDMQGFSGTPVFVAPEKWKAGKETGLPSDCYSMGVTIADFLNIKLLNVNNVPENAFPVYGKKVVSSKGNEEGTSAFLVAQMIHPDPQKRFTVDQAIALVESMNGDNF